MSTSQVATPTVQSAVDLYAKALRAPRSLFDLYPDPMPSGAPEKKFRGIPPAVVQGVTAAFEAFAEELAVIAMLRNGETWAQIAANADMSNPTLAELCKTLKDAAGIEVKEPEVEGNDTWKLKIWTKTKPDQSRWWQRSKELAWADLLADSKAWMQVRHCLTHGLVVGTEPAFWPGPITKRAYSNRADLPTASSVLAEASGGRRSLTMYPAINCSLVYSYGGAEIAEQVARALGENANVGDLFLFDWLGVPARFPAPRGAGVSGVKGGPQDRRARGRLRSTLPSGGAGPCPSGHGKTGGEAASIARPRGWTAVLTQRPFLPGRTRYRPGTSCRAVTETTPE